jgi:hypothetical protein
MSNPQLASFTQVTGGWLQSGLNASARNRQQGSVIPGGPSTCVTATLRVPSLSDRSFANRNTEEDS